MTPVASPTKKLYWSRPYDTEFKAEVVEIRENGIVLDKTLFYPSSGGQETDTGQLRIGDVFIEVDKASLDGDVIVHHFSEPYHGCIEPEDDVEGRIDWERRYMLMKTHTAQHVLSAFIKNDLGAETSAVAIHPGLCHLKLDRPVKDGDISQALEKSLVYISNGNDVETELLPRNEAVERYEGKVRGTIVDADTVRLVHLPGLEIMCCGGIHVRNTREIGAIFLSTFKRGTSIELLVGRDALSSIADANTVLLRLARRFDNSLDGLEKRVQDALVARDQCKQASARLSEGLVSILAGPGGEIVNGIKIHVLDLPVDGKAVIRAFKNVDREMLLVIKDGNGNLLVCSSAPGAGANDVLKAIVDVLGGKGGGNPRIAQGRLDPVIGKNDGGRPGPTLDDVAVVVRKHLEEL